MTDVLAQLRAAGFVTPLDEQLARSLCDLASEQDERVLLAIALLSRQVSNGHVCLPLSAVARGEPVFGDDSPPPGVDWPEASSWLQALRDSVLCGDQPGQPTPLALDAQGRLYLRRHFERERALADQILRRARHTLPPNQAQLTQRLDHYFGGDPNDSQRQAAKLALTRAFCVISGGPGTGKTSTVVKILALLVEQARAAGSAAPRIALVAPTGKAAARLKAAVEQAKGSLDCDDHVRAGIPEAATTIHRALRDPARARDGRVTLGLDILLVDEASMVDLELMAELLGALPEQARVILLGDRHQLASVEAGAVLGDICGVGVEHSREQATGSRPGLAESIVVLTRSYRYAADSGIGELARAIQAGDSERALSVLADPTYDDVRLRQGAPKGLSRSLADAIVAGYRPYLESRADPAAALRAFDAFRVLCAHRRSEQGVAALNSQITRLLFERGLIEDDQGHFPGRALLITQNDYRNQLWNGDVGLVRRNALGATVACFIGTDGHREIGLGRLSSYEDAFAISVHKSQGSEVDEVALVLPHEPSRVLTRELLYTAVTRARKRVSIFGSGTLVAWAIAHRVARNTGLRDLLY
jgi:exodeoxyribonuclease V alpha subunit